MATQEIKVVNNYLQSREDPSVADFVQNHIDFIIQNTPNDKSINRFWPNIIHKVALKANKDLLSILLNRITTIISVRCTKSNYTLDKKQSGCELEGVVCNSTGTGTTNSNNSNIINTTAASSSTANISTNPAMITDNDNNNTTPPPSGDDVSTSK